MANANLVKLNECKEALVKKRGIIEKMLPAALNGDRFLSVAIRALSKNPALLNCTKESFVQSVMLAGELGLEPSGVLGEAYLVPFKDTCTLIPGYRGLITLARRSGYVKRIEAHVVCENDQFDYSLGSAPYLSHQPTLKGRGDMIAAYAVATLNDDTKQFEVMGKEDIDKIRSRSRAANNGPWVTDYFEMSKKTVTKRLLKYLPMSVQLATAMDADNRIETGEGIVDLLESDVESIPSAPKRSATEGLQEKLENKKRGRPPRQASSLSDSPESAVPPTPESNDDEAVKAKIIADITMCCTLLGEDASAIKQGMGMDVFELEDLSLADLGQLRAALNRAVDEKEAQK